MKHRYVLARNFKATTYFLGLSALLIFIFATLLFGQPKAFDKLSIKKPIKCAISPEEIHDYKLYLETGQYAHLTIKSPTVQLIEMVALSDSQNVMYARFDSSEGFSIKLVAEQTDLYRVQLKAPAQSEKGTYIIVLEELRSATARDKAEVSAKMKYDEAMLLENRGDAESLKSAKQKYDESLQLWQTIENSEMTIATLRRLGEMCFRVSDYQGMQIYYYKALRHSREHKDRDGEATALHKIGVARMSMNEAFEALDNLEEALKMSQQLKNSELEADILDTFGQIYTELDDYEKGVKYAQRSLAIRKTLGDKEKIATSLQTLAQAYDNLGENQKALDYYREALGLFRQVGQRYSEAIVLGQIGYIYDEFGQYESALDYFQQCLDISEVIGNRFGQAWAIKIMGDIRRKMGDNESAIRNYTTSLEICRQISVRIGVAANLSNLALVYTAMDSTDKALELLNESLVMHREINDREGSANILNKIGNIYADRGDINKAIDYHQQALTIAQTLQDPKLLQNTYFVLGKQERRARNLETAREYIEKSIQLADSLRGSVLNQNMRASYFATIHNCYDELLLLFMQQHLKNPNDGYDRLALQISEKSRGQSLLEMLNEAQIDLRTGMDPELLDRERRVRQELNAKEQQRQKLASQGESDALAPLEKDIRTLLSEHENLEIRIRKEQPRLATIEKAEALPSERIQTDVLDDSTVLIEYILIDERSFAWAVTSDNIECVELPPSLKIDETARLVYHNLTARNIISKDESFGQQHARIQASEEKLYAALSDLSDQILMPLAEHLKKPRIIFVCDEILQYIPMAALPMPDDDKKNKKSYDPLVNHFQILSVSSASALPLIREEKTKARHPDKLIAIFADPVFSTNDPRLASSVPARDDSSDLTAYDNLDKALLESGVGTRSDLSRLPFSRMEANEIISLGGTDNCQCFMDFDANYSNAISSSLSNFKIIHFATHGMMNTLHPELSGLVLSLFDQAGQPQNGFLRLHDIYQLDLNAYLVVLSGCQTALGKNIRGEGLIGLTRGFMYAGASQVVASLWKVDDEATAELMKRFYQYLLGDDQLPTSAALQKAQLSVMNEQRWQSPYYWAGFVLQGDWK